MKKKGLQSKKKKSRWTKKNFFLWNLKLAIGLFFILHYVPLLQNTFFL